MIATAPACYDRVEIADKFFSHDGVEKSMRDQARAVKKMVIGSGLMGAASRRYRRISVKILIKDVSLNALRACGGLERACKKNEGGSDYTV